VLALELSAPALSAIAIAVLWTAEGLIPFFGHRPDSGRWRNLAIGLINSAIAGTVLAGLVYFVTTTTAKHSFGLLHWTHWPLGIDWLLALLALDVWHYAAHIASHRIPFLWRLHIVHHHDEHIDFTTGVRFHAFDVVSMCLMLLPLVALLGVTTPQFLLYKAILVPNAMFHHSNLALPLWLDRPLRWLIVTPRMHWVHHSRWQPETDSNYGAVLSLWDRLFGTLRLRANPSTLEIGLDGYEGASTRTVLGMLATPFSRVRSGPGRPPPEAGPTAGNATNLHKPQRRPHQTPQPTARPDTPL